MLPDIPEMLGLLVGTPSVSSTSPTMDQSNLGVLEHLAGWLEDLNFAVEFHQVTSNNDKFNLIARRGIGDGGFLLAGHTDTVPCDENLWSYDPFQVTERDGRYYGLGTCDMKGFFPIALSAVAEFSNKELRKPLTILATSDEESTMAGARHVAENAEIHAEGAIIGEPTDLQPIYAHKGIFILKIHTQGSSGHSSDPALGINALDGMHSVLSVLIAFREELKSKFSHAGFEVRFPTLNLGCLHAGDSANRICGGADLLIDLRILPGMSSEVVLNELLERLKKLENDIDMPIRIELGFPPIEPFETPTDGALLRTLEKLSGRSAGTVAFGTEAPFLHQRGIETVVFGPGSIQQAHQADEFLARTQIEPTQTILKNLIARYCCS